MKATLHAMPVSLVDNTGDKHSDIDGRPLFYYKATGKSNNRSIKEEAKGKETSIVPIAVMLQSPIVVKDEKKDQSVGYERSGEMGSLEVGSLICIEDSSRPTSPNHNASSEKQVKHESARVEMVKAKEENERLKLTLAGTVKDHQSLQMHFFEIVQPEQPKKPIEAPSIHHDVEESELVSLRLGTSSTKHKKEEKASTCDKRQEDEQITEGLTLALDCEFGGSGNSLSGAPLTLSRADSYSELKENETTGPWPPCKIRKNLTSGEDEMLQQIGVKRARISVRTRCTDRTLYDGCQWRKYGEKITKGNPCPRAYYRCTVAQGCPVKKQVQRCAEDTSILITTYEGIHNHPLPVSAATIASTTSAAACLLMSGSSTSRPLIGSSASFPATTSMTTSANLHGLNFTPSENCRPGQFYLANSSVSPSHPTITLDLTAPSPSNSTITPSSRYSTSLNLSSSQHNAMQSSCSSGYLSYGAQQYNISQTGSLSFVRQYQDSFYQSGMATNTSLPLADTSFINTIAEAITSDPSFQSALAAAITTYVGVRGAE